MLLKVQGRIRYIEDLVRHHKTIPPGNQEKNIEEKKKGRGVGMYDVSFKNIQ